jgi:hypothetical protein
MRKTTLSAYTVENVIRPRNEAKENKAKWDEIRKQHETTLLTILESSINGVLEDVNSSEATLTMSLQLEDERGLKVGQVRGIGYRLKLDQAAIAELVDRHPELLGVVFKCEYKADVKALLKASAADTDLGKALLATFRYDEATPSLEL